MADNSRKTPLINSLGQFAERKVSQRIEILGKALPCSIVDIDPTGTIVTVKFEVQTDFTLPQITVPVIGAEYIRFPLQKPKEKTDDAPAKPGTMGVVFPIDVPIGGVTGLGADGPTSIQTPANLAALVFCPVGNKNWDEIDDPQSVVIYGPNGCIIRNTEGDTIFTLTPDGLVVDAKTSITLSVEDVSLVVTKDNVTINGDLVVKGAIDADDEITAMGSHTVSAHTHTQGVDSHGDTEQDTATPTG